MVSLGLHDITCRGKVCSKDASLSANGSRARRRSAANGCAKGLCLAPRCARFDVVRSSDPSEGEGLLKLLTPLISVDISIILQHVFPVTHLTSHVTIISRSWCMEFWDPSRCLASSLAFPSVPSDFLQLRLVRRSQKTWEVPPLDMIDAVDAGRLWSTEELEHSFASVVESYRSAGVSRSHEPHFHWYHISYSI